MATTSKDIKMNEANRQLRIAFRECNKLLARTEEMLRRSGQDNDKPCTD